MLMRLNWIHFLLIIPVFSLSCDEALPSRQDPSSLFKARVQPFYVYSAFQNDVVVNLIAVNEFDETLNDRAGITGAITITSDRDTSIHKTIQLGPNNLIYGKYDAVKGILTIDPGDSVIIQAVWDFTDDSGASLTNGFFSYHIDRTCRQRLIASSETFSIVGKTKLYSQLGYAQSRMTFGIVQYDIFVGPHDCLPL